MSSPHSLPYESLPLSVCLCVLRITLCVCLMPVSASAGERFPAIISCLIFLLILSLPPTPPPPPLLLPLLQLSLCCRDPHLSSPSPVSLPPATCVCVIECSFFPVSSFLRRFICHNSLARSDWQRDDDDDDRREAQELPCSKSSYMITLYLEDGVSLTIRTSGTEPKIKYYSEAIGSPGDK